ncbi:hypothetical protein EDB38_12018 [Vibrio crassostreae]|jgi:hypothetical protein|nr:hypothetical protein EDB58_11274 [Vibrio crassostreae]TCL18845.1 hypothetical protein EDB52_11764 [Vibrio crassostreae]TCN05055.1 hypothetical protein EDB35_11948 [Vibrio crassostreae]TCN91581.1 hypothetical protein EDB50_11812 [Vibrio crassostreae]TCN96091.1 hypothetical protein EDB30_11973 [Vibrio crassostreae]
MIILQSHVYDKKVIVQKEECQQECSIIAMLKIMTLRIKI